MSSAVAESTEKSNENAPKDNNNRNNRNRGRRPRNRVNDQNENVESNNRNPNNPNFDEHAEGGADREQRRPFMRSYIDRIEDKIAYLSYNPTVELPPIDVNERKFSGRNRVYISSIGSDFTEEDLENLFKPYGETAEVFINKEKKFGFLKMDYFANAQKARQELDGTCLKSKTLRIRISPSCGSVKVKNLSHYVTNELLHYAFSVFGEVENAYVLVDEKGRSTGEGIVDFSRKMNAIHAVQKCNEKCYFLTYSLKPVIVELHEFCDPTAGLSDKHFNIRNVEFNQERSTGPRLAELGSFDHEYGERWKKLYELFRQKEDAMRIEFRLECEKLEAQMEYARYEHETESLREQLRQREMARDRQKREWEAAERRAEEERLRTEAQIRQAHEQLDMKHPTARQHDFIRRRQEDEANLLLKAQNLSSILETQERLEYELPTSSTRESTGAKSGDSSLLINWPDSGKFESAWNGSTQSTQQSGMEGHWVREDTRDRNYQAKKRRNMVVLRVHGEEFIFPTSLHHPMQPRIPQMNMMKVHIPFTFKLLETSRSSYSELQCSMSSQVRYQVYAYWGVNIRELHIFLWRPWADIKNACAGGDFLKGYYQCLGVQLERKSHPDQVITLTYSGQKPLDLGTPPRLCYPLVIFLIRNGLTENVHPDETVALINVVHIKDSVCTLPTSILGQYLKQANGQLSCLKQLYLATGNSGNYESSLPLAVAEPVEGGPSSVGSFCQNNDDSTFWNSSGEQLCVVCQTYPLSRALLPCRHTCICASCFNKLERCPMCRGPIKSYFCIRGEEYMHAKENSTSPKNDEGPPVRRRWFNAIQNWDDRLIDFLGFSR